MRCEKFKDDNGDWVYTSKEGITKKLLCNPETNQPYKQNDIILNEGKYKGRVFTQYRYNRNLSRLEKDYWGIICKVIAKELPRDVKGYKIPTPNDYRPIWSQKLVNYETASRAGEPFDELIIKTQMLPNLHRRLCTIQLKINPIQRFMRSLGYEEWYQVLGLRYDEPKRVVDSKARLDRSINI